MTKLRLRATAAVLAALTGLAEPVRLDAQEEVGEPIITDRPDFTESAATVAPGRFQLEGGYTFTRLSSEKQHSIGEVLVRLGVLEPLEARIGLNSVAVIDAPDSHASGLEDLSLGAKVRFLRRDAGASRLVPDISLLGALILPTGAEEVGEDEVQPSAILAAAWELSDRVSVGSNLGYENRADGDERIDELFGSVAVGLGLTERWGAFLEYFGFFPERGGGPTTHFVDAGLTLLFGRDVQLDWRAGLGLDDPEPNYFLGIGVSWRR
ncbi:MAG: transporter [Gemmatimonadota bacterium]